VLVLMRDVRREYTLVISVAGKIGEETRYGEVPVHYRPLNPPQSSNLPH
jgi:hypothetical protein